MKKSIIFYAILLGVGIFLFLQKYYPCDHPLSYKIGSIDPQFNVSEEEVLSDAQAATDILNNASQKKLFTYSDSAQLTVNFAYDNRAELDTKINNLQNQVTDQGKTLKQQIQDYESESSKFQQKITDFRAKVEQYNKEGGAPPEVYDSLVQEQKSLRAEATSLNAWADKLNLSTKEYNLNVSNLNNDTAKFNDEITQRPEEGQYNSQKNTITLYFASKHNELIHTMAHEFGHALGMDHVSDSKAIMYPYSTESITPTHDDMNELATVCKPIPLAIYLARTADTWLILNIYPYIQNFIQKFTT